jgi:hypothetical protein
LDPDDVIENHHAVTSVVSGPAPRRRPAPLEQPTAVREEPHRTGNGWPEPEALRVLAERYAADGEQSRSSNRAALGLRASRATNAYAATESMAEREYVQRYLGVDDWV